MLGVLVGAWDINARASVSGKIMSVGIVVVADGTLVMELFI